MQIFCLNNKQRQNFNGIEKKKNRYSWSFFFPQFLNMKYRRLQFKFMLLGLQHFLLFNYYLQIYLFVFVRLL